MNNIINTTNTVNITVDVTKLAQLQELVSKNIPGGKVELAADGSFNISSSTMNKAQITAVLMGDTGISFDGVIHKIEGGIFWAAKKTSKALGGGASVAVALGSASLGVATDALNAVTTAAKEKGLDKKVVELGTTVGSVATGSLAVGLKVVNDVAAGQNVADIKHEFGRAWKGVKSVFGGNALGIKVNDNK